MMKPVERLLLILSLTFSVLEISCGSTTEARVATTVTAISSTALTGVAGDPVVPAPSVIVKDQNGAAMPGVTVIFAVTGGQGTVDGGSVITNPNGVATVGSWTLDPKVGTNTLSASVDGTTPLVFSATGLPGPPTTLIPHNDNQIAAVGNPVTLPPAVTVTDKNGNVISGMGVVFEVGFGIGWVTGANATTDANGLASVGSWTLGHAGTNQLTANVPGRVFIVFNAEGVGPCMAPRQLAFGTAFNGFLSISDCHLDNGRYGEFSQTSADGSFSVSLTSPTFDPHLYVYTPDNTIIAENDNASLGTQSSSLRIIGPASPGTYVFVASSAHLDQEGDYTLSTAAVSASLTDCQQAWIVRGAVTSQQLENTDCVGASFYDRYSIYLKAGESVTISMAATGFEKNLELYDVTGSKVAAATGSSEINYTPLDTGYFVIRAGSVAANQTGAYTLSVK